MTDLNDLHDEIRAYLKTVQIKVFPGDIDLSNDDITSINWNEEDHDWKAFIDIAKSMGVPFMIIHRTLGEGGHSKDIGSLMLAWIKDRLFYIFEKRAEWFELEVSEQKDERLEDRSEARSLGMNYQVPKKIREELLKKSEDDLADEVVAFASTEFPEQLGVMRASEVTRLFWQKKGLMSLFFEDSELSIKIRKVDMLAEQRLQQTMYAGFLEQKDEMIVEEAMKFVRENSTGGPISFRALDMFWESKGIKRYTAPANVRLKVEQAEAIAKQKLNEELLSREKEQLPQLTDDCLKWAEKNKLTKCTKANIDYFVTSKGIQLSKLSRDALYNEVNFRLKK